MASHGRTIQGKDGKTASGTQPDPLGLGSKKSFSEGLDKRGPSGIKAKPGSSTSAKNYFVGNLPSILTAKGYPIATAFMDFWLSNKGYQKGTTSGAIHRSRVLDHDDLMGWKQTSKHPLKTLKQQRPWLGARKDEWITRLKARWKSSGQTSGKISFPDPVVDKPPALTKKSGNTPYNEPTSNDATWADEVDFWGLWIADSASDGAGAITMATSTLDDYSFAVGNFDWYFLPKGTAIFVPAAGNAPDRLIATVTEIGVYAKDSYDFNGAQYLGNFNIESKDFSKLATFLPWPLLRNLPDDGLYQADMGWRRVYNESFRIYRDKSGNGCDFLLYSEVKFTPFQGGDLTFDL